MTAAIADREYLLALRSARAGQKPEAERLCRAAIAHAPRHGRALRLLGTLVGDRGDCAEALALLRAAVAAAPYLPEGHFSLGNALLNLDQVVEAADCFKAALDIDPNHIGALINLASALKALCIWDEAQRAALRAIALRPKDAALRYNLGNVLHVMGRPAEAAAAFRDAVSLNPINAKYHYNLAIALRDADHREEAALACENALSLRPDLDDAVYVLGTTLFDEKDPARFEAALQRHVNRAPNAALAHFYLGLVRDQIGHREAAAGHFARLTEYDPDEDYRLASWRYAVTHSTGRTRLLADGRDAFRLGLAAARSDGFILEFGVRNGASIRHIASLTSDTVHGFDSFVGLPEQWGDNPSGVYTVHGQTPPLPDNVQLHVGWFAETLPQFVDNFAGPIRFLHIDCDIYSSTRTVFIHVAGRVGPGTVILFDEYLMNPGWQGDEHRALTEAAAENGWSYEYLAFNLFTQQALVKLK